MSGAVQASTRILLVDPRRPQVPSAYSSDADCIFIVHAFIIETALGWNPLWFLEAALLVSNCSG